MNTTISIIGFGNIGKMICGLLLNEKEHAYTLNVMDVNDEVQGAILDFKHGIQIESTHKLTYNNRELFNQSDFIFHCAGASVPKGESRLYTCQQSVDITEAVFENFKPSKNPFIIVVANPVEIITTVTQQITQLPEGHVFGTGTFLDSMRMNHVVKEDNEKVSEVKAILLGEHGSSVFLSEQLSSVDDLPFSKRFNEEERTSYLDKVKHAAEEIKSTQKATIFGVCYCAIALFEALMSEEAIYQPVSVPVPNFLRKKLREESVCLSLYCKIDRNGAIPDDAYDPSASELEDLRRSFDVIRNCLPHKYL
ncbi:MAG: hypothetical protein HWE22_04435 [Flavobacteriales bacterium]|nr:hypothetical protein [Flavobacteriales bacterium]